MTRGHEQLADVVRISAGAVRAVYGLPGAGDGVEIDRDAVRRRRVDDGVGVGAAVVDVVAQARSADDRIVAAASIDDVVAVSGLDGVIAGAGSDVVVAAAGDDVIVAVAGMDVGRHVVWNCDVDVIVGVGDVDGNRVGGRLGELDRVAGMSGGLDGLLQCGEAAIAEQYVAAAAVLDELDVGQGVGALVGAAIHRPAASAVRDDVAERKRGRIGGRVLLGPAVERIVAARAGQGVGADAPGDGVVAAAADGVLDRCERCRSAHARGCARGQIDADAGAGVRVADRIAAGAAVNRRGAAVVLEMEGRPAVAGVDDLAVWPGQIDTDRLRDGCAVRVVVDDGPNVEGRGPCNAADI